MERRQYIAVFVRGREGKSKDMEFIDMMGWKEGRRAGRTKLQSLSSRLRKLNSSRASDSGLEGIGGMFRYIVSRSYHFVSVLRCDLYFRRDT